VHLTGSWFRAHSIQFYSIPLTEVIFRKEVFNAAQQALEFIGFRLQSLDVLFKEALISSFLDRQLNVALQGNAYAAALGGIDTI
jgi:hypothetical protein